MATANLHIHEVARVSVTSERLGNKTLQRVVIYDRDGVQMRLTLYGLDSALGDIPYTFSKIEDEVDEPPAPAVKLEIDPLIRQGKIWGEVMDTLIYGKKA